MLVGHIICEDKPFGDIHGIWTRPISENIKVIAAIGTKSTNQAAQFTNFNARSHQQKNKLNSSQYY